MFNRYGRFPQLPFWAKVGEIPTSYKVAMSYEEQLLWLCHEIEKIKGSSGNIDYNALENKPVINGVTLQGTLTLNDLDIQQKLRAGNGIIIDGNIISATGGGSGGTDNYNLLNNKPSINGVTLVGDKSFSDLGLETTKSYEELTSYVDGYYFDIPLIVGTGDPVPTPSQNANSKYLVIDLSEYPQAKYRVSGYSSSCIWFTCSANPLLDSSIIASKSANEVGYTEEEIEVTIRDNSNYLVFNFTNTNTNTPKVERIIETVGGTSNYNELDNKPSINGVTLIGNKSWSDLGLQFQKNYEALTNYVDNYYFPVTDIVFINDYVPSPESSANSKYMAIPISSLPSNKFRITGYNGSASVWFTCSDNPTLNTSLVKSKSPSNTGYTNEEMVIPFPEGANYIVFNFTDTNLVNPSVEVITETISTEDVKNLEANLDLNEGQPISLASGFYNTAGYKVRHLTLFEAEDWIGNYEIFYVANNSTIISDNYNIVLVDDGESVNWTFDTHSGVTNEIVNDSTMIPTSKAVYDALQNIEPSGSNFYTEIDSNITFNQDGTTTPALQTGYYFLKSPRSINYYDYDGNLQTDYQINNGIFYYDSTEKDLKRTGINKENTNEIEYRLHYFSSHNGYWDLSTVDENNFVKNLTGNYSYLRTSIPETR